MEKKKLTQQNAHEYLGKNIDLTVRRFGHYPYRVGQWSNGVFYITDRNNVEMRVPDESDIFNSIYFDIVYD